MSPWTTALVCGLLGIAAVYALRRAFLGPRLTLRSMQARMNPTARLASERVDQQPGLVRRIGVALAGGPLGRLIEERLGKSLRLAGFTVPFVVGQVVTSTLVALFATGMVALALMSAGVVGSSPLLWLLVVCASVMFGWRVVADVRTRATRRQRGLRRVVNDFVQLLAVALTTNRSVEDAIAFAADAGEGDGFELLRETISTAQPMGISVWDALNGMADTYDLPELRGLTTSLQRQANVGVSVATTIRTEAKSLRDKQLADLKDRADKANSNLSIPTMGMVFGMVLFLAFPIMQQISQAFT
ncbi:MAG: type II secretion system F family protein [Ilumatobacter sp.]|uniref:type II secretion system F family protein n=1 Tax=Ilumatobacter sp. TaxID=1967498 RepID=UPI00391CFBFA